jgi:hypothetical protein
VNSGEAVVQAELGAYFLASREFFHARLRFRWPTGVFSVAVLVPDARIKMRSPGAIALVVGMR